MALPDQITFASSPALSRNVVDALRAMIASGAVGEGEHLKESELADALGVSRGPIREAFQQLENEGFIELRRHRGAFVTTLRRRDIEEVYSLRIALEQLAMERAATRITPAILARMNEVLDAMQHVSPDAPASEAVALDLDFHDLVYEAADHDRLMRSWRYIRSQVSFFLQVRNRSHPDFVSVGYAEHRQIRDVLVAGDPGRRPTRSSTTSGDALPAPRRSRERPGLIAASGRRDPA
ncbi:GntR family transcriptional regulator [Frondihabitans sucicola]|uniref:GntR family transcriptional regulator n=1 Tax=Frondihabitans sucicola TaxID=1268041 RepID=A0ABM8GP67_9MICO|nr:GntR family transcriptional regulator [Frondihabitans sucicola]BDZ50242.1 GntR family transcriptional regulator [Frondihabitans sucicola]